MAARKFLSKSLQLTKNNFGRTLFSEHMPSGARLSDDLHSRNSTTSSQTVGKTHTVTMVPGVGTGPELMSYVEEIIKYVEAPIDFEVISTEGVKTQEDQQQYLKDVIASIKRTGVAIKGNIEMDGSIEQNGLDEVKESRCYQVRKELDLYVMLSRCKSFPNVQAKYENIDVTLVRENLGGFYSMIEQETVPGVVENLKIITKENAKRVAEFAFAYAQREGKKKVTTVHKANIMKLSDGLFLQVANEVAKGYPKIQHENMIIDNCCMQLVSNPLQFQVMLLPNLYGSICSNVISGLTGGPGLMAGQNIGPNCAVFEAMTRNSGTVIAGKNTANPTAILKAAADLLEYLGLTRDAFIINKAISLTLSEDLVHTPDIGGTATSREVVDNIKKRIFAGYQNTSCSIESGY